MVLSYSWWYLSHFLIRSIWEMIEASVRHYYLEMNTKSFSLEVQSWNHFWYDASGQWYLRRLCFPSGSTFSRGVIGCWTPKSVMFSKTFRQELPVRFCPGLLWSMRSMNSIEIWLVIRILPFYGAAGNLFPNPTFSSKILLSETNWP